MDIGIVERRWSDAHTSETVATRSISPAGQAKRMPCMSLSETYIGDVVPVAPEVFVMSILGTHRLSI
jgi:hypothetical protein